MKLKQILKKTVTRVPGAKRVAKALGLTVGYQAKYLRDCYKTYDRYLEMYPSSNPKGYVVVMDINHRILTGLMVPIAQALLKRQFTICSVMKERIPKSSLPELAGISGAISHGTWHVDGNAAIGGLFNKWDIDWKREIVSTGGINYFPYFLERISKLSKKYRSDLTQHNEIKVFNEVLRQADAAIVVCNRIVELSRSTRKPIRIAAMDTHFAPWGVVRRWCSEVGAHHNIHFMALSSGYENYYSNLTTIEATTIAVEDLTRNPDLRHPFLGGKSRFDAYVREHPDSLQNMDTPLEWIRVNRSKTSSTDTLRHRTLEKVAEARREGRRVFAAYGKVLIDFAAPDDRGNVFDSFPDWVNGLIELASTNNSLLIIKPHPHEIREEIVLDGVQTLRDLLPRDLPPNVQFLNHNSFNSFELAELVDASFVWNGTICCEFPVINAPVAAESIWAPRDYPINLPRLMSMGDYEKAFSTPEIVRASEQTRALAAAYLQFLKSDEVMLPFHYLRRAGTNKAIGRNYLYHEKLERLEKDGDPIIDRVVDRFFPQTSADTSY